MDPFVGQRSGRYRPRVVSRAPQCIPDGRFDEVFARLGSRRDRALVAGWVSTGELAAELMGETACDADPGQQVITVVRNGTQVLQQVPASPDAFEWLRLYRAQLTGLVPAGPTVELRPAVSTHTRWSPIHGSVKGPMILVVGAFGRGLGSTHQG